MDKQCLVAELIIVAIKLTGWRNVEEISAQEFYIGVLGLKLDYA